MAKACINIVAIMKKNNHLEMASIENKYHGRRNSHGMSCGGENGINVSASAIISMWRNGWHQAAMKSMA